MKISKEQVNKLVSDGELLSTEQGIYRGKFPEFVYSGLEIPPEVTDNDRFYIKKRNYVYYLYIHTKDDAGNETVKRFILTDRIRKELGIWYL